MVSFIWVNIVSSNGLLSNGTKPLPESSVDLSSMGFCSIYMKAVSWELLKISTHQISLRIAYSKLLPNLPGANELI